MVLEPGTSYFDRVGGGGLNRVATSLQKSLNFLLILEMSLNFSEKLFDLDL